MIEVNLVKKCYDCYKNCLEHSKTIKKLQDMKATQSVKMGQKFGFSVPTSLGWAKLYHFGV